MSLQVRRPRPCMAAPTPFCDSSSGAVMRARSPSRCVSHSFSRFAQAWRRRARRLPSFIVVHYVLGLLGALECASSSRVAGVARFMFLTKKKKRQRPALTAKMVAALEKLAADPDAPSLDRVIAGFFVLLVYTRGRFSDGLNMQNLRAEVPASASANSLAGYVEADVSRTKAAYTLERKTMYLPIVAPRHGVTDHDWFSGFLEARQASCVPSGPGIPLLPARSSSSGWATVPPTAGVAASWLRGTLQSLGFAARDISPIGTHSCKTTTLSWASKAGLSTATRRALGYHSASDDKIGSCLLQGCHVGAGA